MSDCDPVRIFGHWPRICAVDIRHNQISALWGAYDRAADTLYLTEEMVLPRVDLPALAESIRKRADWMPVLFDLVAGGRKQAAGEALWARLVDLKLDVYSIECDQEHAILEMSARLGTGRMKVFSTLTNWIAQYRNYRRDETGKIIGTSGLMDATGLIVLRGNVVALSEDQATTKPEDVLADEGAGRSSVTGY